MHSLTRKAGNTRHARIEAKELALNTTNADSLPGSGNAGTRLAVSTLVLFLGLLLASRSAYSMPITLDFTTPDLFSFASYEEDGFVVNPITFAGRITNGELSVFGFSGSSEIRIRTTDSSLFRFLSFDLRSEDANSPSTSFIISGFRNNTLVDLFGSFSTTSNVPQTFTFGNSADLDQIRIISNQSSTGSDPFMDNFVFDLLPVNMDPPTTILPIPSSLALLAIGLALLAPGRRV